MDSVSFNVKNMRIIKDVNKDGYDDIIMDDYGFYPYYYSNCILKGSWPINLIPDFGLNTQNQGFDLTNLVELGDVNGDKFNDFMSLTYSVPPNIKLWLGGRKIHTVADKTWYGTDPDGFARFGNAIGDVNGDGVNDIAIGEMSFHSPFVCRPGYVHIFSGDTTVKADTISTVTDTGNIIPSEYKLNEPYPNPFNPSTVISWYSPKRVRTIIKVYSTIGQEITILLDKETPQGDNNLEFDAGKYKLSSGIYILQFEAFEQGKVTFKETKKLSYIK